jgi:hypothetical protein
MSTTNSGGSDPTSAMEEITIGDYVYDTESDDPDIAQVINAPGLPAKDWDSHKTDDGEVVTVAETNPSYDPNEKVVVCLFRPQIETHYPTWDGESPMDLATVTDDGVTHYAFPQSRVAHVDPSDTTIQSPPEWMQSLAEEIESGATTAIKFTDGNYEIRVNKLGTEYTIQEDGSVHGSGPFKDPFTEKAQKAINNT